MSVFVLDASAMVAYLAGETGAEIVETLLSDTKSTCFAHAINLCEVYYDSLRSTNEYSARQAIRDLSNAGIVTRRDLSEDFCRKVGRLKSLGRISLADCFGIALAQKLEGKIVTSDHHEFDRLVPLNIVSIHFIR